MKREGRIHGCNVRLGKRAWGYGQGHGGKVMPNKPTNQSKNAMKHPIVPAVAHVVYSEHEMPSQKAIGKTKHAFKAKDLDITRNHLMQDWSIYKRGLSGEESYGDDSYGYGYGAAGGQEDEGEQEQEQQEVSEEEYQEAAVGSETQIRARNSEIVLPIESLLTMRKRKVAPKARAGRRQGLPLTVTDAAGAEIALDQAAADAISDEFESWWGLGFYDEEEVQEEWFLISEGEGFMAA